MIFFPFKILNLIKNVILAPSRLPCFILGLKLAGHVFLCGYKRKLTSNCYRNTFLFDNYYRITATRHFPRHLLPKGFCLSSKNVHFTVTAAPFWAHACSKVETVDILMIMKRPDAIIQRFLQNIIKSDVRAFRKLCHKCRGGVKTGTSDNSRRWKTNLCWCR